MKYYVYRYIDPISSYILYIGKGKDDRIFDHIKRAKLLFERNEKSTHIFKNKLLKLLRNNIEPIIEIIEDDLEEDQALLLETELIRLLGRKYIDEGGILYNRTLGGEGESGRILSNASRAKISKALTGRKIPQHTIEKRTKTLRENIKNGSTILYRKKLSEEEKRVRKNTLNFSDEAKKQMVERMLNTKSLWDEGKRLTYSRKLSEANKGKKRTEQQKENIRNGLLRSEYHHSEETRNKISLAQKGKSRDARMKFILLSPMAEILEIEKIVDFCKNNKISIASIYRTLKSQRPISRGPTKGWQLLKIIPV